MTERRLPRRDHDGRREGREPHGDHDAERRRLGRHREPEPQLRHPRRQSAVRRRACSATRPTNKGDVKAQTAESLARIGRTLKAAGFDWSNVVDGIVYLPDMAQVHDMNDGYREVFTKDFPARATVGAGLMGADAQVEIMMTAVK